MTMNSLREDVNRTLRAHESRTLWRLAIAQLERARDSVDATRSALDRWAACRRKSRTQMPTTIKRILP